VIVRRRLFIAAGGLTLCIALALIGGWPDPGRSLDLLTGRNVSGATEASFVTLLCWLAAIALAATAVVAWRRQRGRPRTRYLGSLSVALIGFLLFGAGVARQGGYGVCCATPTTAQQAEQLVH
jgi:ABC-type Na+ efflux pump permease subunit